MESYKIVAIYNIPEDYDTFSLREFFHQLICKEAFELFHFKNRPEGNIRQILKLACPDTNLFESAIHNPVEIIPEMTTVTFDFNSILGKTEESDSSSHVKVVDEEVAAATYGQHKSGFLKIRNAYYDELISVYGGREWRPEGDTSSDRYCCRLVTLPGVCVILFKT